MQPSDEMRARASDPAFVEECARAGWAVRWHPGPMSREWGNAVASFLAQPLVPDLYFGEDEKRAVLTRAAELLEAEAQQCARVIRDAVARGGVGADVTEFDDRAEKARDVRVVGPGTRSALITRSHELRERYCAATDEQQRAAEKALRMVRK